MNKRLLVLLCLLLMSTSALSSTLKMTYDQISSCYKSFVGYDGGIFKGLYGETIANGFQSTFTITSTDIVLYIAKHQDKYGNLDVFALHSQRLGELSELVSTPSKMYVEFRADTMNINNDCSKFNWKE